MKRRVGEKDGPEDSSATIDSGSSDERSTGQPPNTAANNNSDDQAIITDDQASSPTPPQAEGLTSRSGSRPVARTGGRRPNSSNPRRAKKARRGDNIEQAMVESCREMAECYKQLVSAVVQQSERDFGRTLETSEELRLITQR